MISKMINDLIGKLGYKLIPSSQSYTEIKDITQDKDFIKILNTVRPFTMTSTERIFALYQSVKYVISNNIPGDFVECGVWRGGSAMVIALTSLAMGDSSRHLYLYDTYEGMSEPTENDKDIYGHNAKALLDIKEKVANVADIWCYSSLEDVKLNLFSTGYPTDKIHFEKGKVEDTIPAFIPSKICILRLDTDWYESTLHEMIHLYPLLSEKGILILDDYGHWQGARKAVDEYFKTNNIQLYLNRIDYTGRISVKC